MAVEGDSGMKRYGLLGFIVLSVGLFVVSIFNLYLFRPWQSAEPEGVIARSLAASVQLYAEREGGVHRWASGVAVAAGGDGRTVILTAAHLLVPSVPQSIYAIVPGHDDRVEARIVAIDELADIAILEAPEMSVTPVALQWSAQLGDNVWVVSFPWGRRGTVVSGVVSQIETSAAETRLPVSGPVGLIDAAVSYGTSGGGVFDARTGHLVGLVRGYRTAKLSLPGTPTQSLDIPIAGETTVISATAIRCLVARSEIEDALKAALDRQIVGMPAAACVDA
jgi:S1-C subfamily serine protease